MPIEVSMSVHRAEPRPTLPGRRSGVLSALVALLLSAVLAQAVFAADHRDGPAVRSDPAADINDLFAWSSSDASMVNLAMTVFPFAAAGARFSDQVQYVFHTSSRAGFGAAASSEVDVLCQFDAQQRVECWIGDQEYVNGDAGGSTGLSSSDGRVRVFAGLRNDPFYFNLNGFNSTRELVIEAAPSLTFDAAGCPQLDSGTATALQQQLRSEPDGSPAVDDFLHANTLVLLVAGEMR